MNAKDTTNLWLHFVTYLPGIIESVGEARGHMVNQIIESMKKNPGEWHVGSTCLSHFALDRRSLRVYGNGRVRMGDADIHLSRAERRVLARAAEACLIDKATLSVATKDATT